VKLDIELPVSQAWGIPPVRASQHLLNRSCRRRCISCARDASSITGIEINVDDGIGQI